MWQGFTVESKKYMSYERMSRRERMRFWFRFPFSWFRFQRGGLTLRAADGLRRLYSWARGAIRRR